MRYAVLGTGPAGRTMAARLDELGHDVAVGTRDPAATRTREDVAEWTSGHPAVRLATYADAASDAEVVLNMTNGDGALDAVAAAGDQLVGKVLLDVSNPLDFSRGFPPRLSVKDTDSLAEQIQRAHPDVIDLGDLSTARGAEMLLPLWVRLMSRLGTARFNVKIVR